MKNKVIAGALAASLILGGAAAAGASKNYSGADDTILQEDKSTSTDETKPAANVNGHEVEIETEHSQTTIKVEADDNNNGKHHGRHSGDDFESDDGLHHNRYSGDDDAKSDDGSHHNSHGSDDD